MNFVKSVKKSVKTPFVQVSNGVFFSVKNARYAFFHFVNVSTLNVGVNVFGNRNGSVTEQILPHFRRNALFFKPRCKRMAQFMRRNVKV